MLFKMMNANPLVILTIFYVPFRVQTRENDY
jgi:hypothetical protein